MSTILRTTTGSHRESPPPVVSRHARVDAAVRLTAGVTLWMGLLLLTYWWAVGGGLSAFGSRQAGLTSVGQLTGLLASDLLLVQVLLMSRIPVLERAFGQDRLARIHRVVGLLSFVLMLVHVLMTTYGYAAGQLRRIPSTVWDLTTNYPGMLLAVAGTACLVMVVATSVKAARARIRYESWHLLHLYAYLGVGLALPHQLWTGQGFLASPAATVYWWSLWAAAAAAVLVWRVALPIWRSARHGLRVTSVSAQAPGVWSVYLTGRHLDRLVTEPGQFFSWRFLGRSGWTRAHPYSLSAAPDGSSLRITVKALGDDSSQLAHLRPGTRVLFEGPFGRLTPRARSRRKVALIGAGVGITPLRALAEGLDYQPGDAVLIQRFGEHPLFSREFDILTEERGLDVIWTGGRRRAPDSWIGDQAVGANDASALRHWVPDIAERDVYVCGPPDWAEKVRRSTRALGVPPENVHLESFQW